MRDAHLGSIGCALLLVSLVLTLTPRSTARITAEPGAMAAAAAVPTDIVQLRVELLNQTLSGGEADLSLALRILAMTRDPRLTEATKVEAGVLLAEASDARRGEIQSWARFRTTWQELDIPLDPGERLAHPALWRSAKRLGPDVQLALLLRAAERGEAMAPWSEIASLGRSDHVRVALAWYQFACGIDEQPWERIASSTTCGPALSRLRAVDPIFDLGLRGSPSRSSSSTSSETRPTGGFAR